MKMAKPREHHIDAAGELLSVLEAIDARWSGPWPIHGVPEDLPKFLEDEDEAFDCENRAHLRVLYNHLARLLRTAPNFHGLVIGGMCYVICYDRNCFLDPAQDVLALHPDVRAGLQLLAQQRADFMPRLERDARAALAQSIEQSAARHLVEMRAARRSH